MRTLFLIYLPADFPVYRLEQNAAEFVILFPRSYQLNFSHGFNFAECVLYAPPDWVRNLFCIV